MLLAACYFFLILGQAGSQVTLILQPGPDEGKDANLWTIYPDNNYGNSLKFACMAWTHSGVPGRSRSMVEFDLSVIPPGMTIVDARLSLYFVNLEPTYFGHTGDNGAWLQLITEPWEENTVTWNNQPATTTFDQVTLPPSTDPYQDYTDIDVTELVHHLYSEPETYHGMMLRLIEESFYRCLLFASSDYLDTIEMRPMLEITYIDCTPPTVSFEYTTTGLSASFTGNSPSATSWHWDFGDGDTSNVQNPEHTYLNQGIYEVCLRVEDTCYFAETCQVVDVCTGPPVPDFTCNLVEMTAFFQNLTSDAQFFHWDFGDGDTSGLVDPVHTYSDLGSYQVCLTAWNNCGTDMYCEFIEICLLPSAAFYYYADGSEVQFWESAQMTERFYWDFGDGKSSEFSNPSHEYSQPGEYYVCLETINDCGTDVLCDWVYVDFTGNPEIPDPETRRFQVYPNPSGGMVSIASEYQGRIKLSLVNLQGKVLMNRDLILDGNDQYLDLSGFQPGIYLLRIHDGTMVSVRKIVLI